MLKKMLCLCIFCFTSIFFGTVSFAQKAELIKEYDLTLYDDMLYRRGLKRIFFGEDQYYGFNTYTGSFISFDTDFAIKSESKDTDYVLYFDSSYQGLMNEDLLVGLVYDTRRLISGHIFRKKEIKVSSIRIEPNTYFSLIYFRDSLLITRARKEGKKDDEYYGFYFEYFFDPVVMDQKALFDFIEKTYKNKNSYRVHGSSIYYRDLFLPLNVEHFKDFYDITSNEFFPGTKLIGFDNNGSSYWGCLADSRFDGGGISIYSSTGKLLNFIDDTDKGSYDYSSPYPRTRSGEIFYSSPFIDPQGNIYYFLYSDFFRDGHDAYGFKKTSLYRIKNTWKPVKPSSFGSLNDSNVRLRAEPNLDSKTIKLLNKNEKVEILSRSKEKQKIGEMNSHWYNVELEDGTMGWVYGKFVDILK